MKKEEEYRPWWEYWGDDDEMIDLVDRVCGGGVHVFYRYGSIEYPNSHDLNGGSWYFQKGGDAEV